MLLAGLLHHTTQETQGCFQPQLALETSACAHSAAGTKLCMHQLGGKVGIRNQKTTPLFSRDRCRSVGDKRGTFLPIAFFINSDWVTYRTCLHLSFLVLSERNESTSFSLLNQFLVNVFRKGFKYQLIYRDKSRGICGSTQTFYVEIL